MTDDQKLLAGCVLRPWSCTASPGGPPLTPGPPLPPSSPSWSPLLFALGHSSFPFVACRKASPCRRFLAGLPQAPRGPSVPLCQQHGLPHQHHCQEQGDGIHIRCRPLRPSHSRQVGDGPTKTALHTITSSFSFPLVSSCRLLRLSTSPSPPDSPSLCSARLLRHSTGAFRPLNAWPPLVKGSGEEIQDLRCRRQRRRRHVIRPQWPSHRCPRGALLFVARRKRRRNVGGPWGKKDSFAPLPASPSPSLPRPSHFFAFAPGAGASAYGRILRALCVPEAFPEYFVPFSASSDLRGHSQAVFRFNDMLRLSCLDPDNPNAALCNETAGEAVAANGTEQRGSADAFVEAQDRMCEPAACYVVGEPIHKSQPPSPGPSLLGSPYVAVPGFLLSCCWSVHHPRVPRWPASYPHALVAPSADGVRVSSAPLTRLPEPCSTWGDGRGTAACH